MVLLLLFEALILALVVLDLEHAYEITDIRLEPDVNNTAVNKGIVNVMFDGAWYSVCYFGGKKTWGRREALIACRQLGFEGGWPSNIRKTVTGGSHRQLNNFDCDGSEMNINNCEYDISNDCKDSVMAGIQCYLSFEVKLTDGSTPNAGRAEVRYDDVWSSVCYESTQSQTRDWSFFNVQVLCRELGFPGAMLTREERQEHGGRRSSVGGYRCSEDLTESSLQDCFPDSPIMLSAQDYGPSCGYGIEAFAICAVPGYIGCFETNHDTHMTPLKLQSPEMTVNVCRNYCRKHNCTHASLYKGDICLCRDYGDELPYTHVGDKECRQECSGDSNQICGDNQTISVYDVTKGVCEDPLNMTAIYYYGDYFKCNPGTEPVNGTSIQCLMGDSSDEMTWNGTLPECIDTDAFNKQGLLIGVTSGVGLLTVTILLVILLVHFSFRRKQKPDYCNITANDEDNVHLYESNAKGETNPLVQESGMDQNILDSGAAKTTALNDNVHQESSIKNKLSKLISFGVKEEKTDEKEEQTRTNQQSGDDVQDQKSGIDQSVLKSSAATTTALNVPQGNSIRNKLSKLISFGGNEENTCKNEEQTRENQQDGDNVQVHESGKDQIVLDSSTVISTALNDKVPQESSIKNKLSKLISFGGNEDKTDENARQTREKEQDDSNPQVKSSDKGETNPLGQTAGKDQNLLDSEAARTIADVPQESSIKYKLSQLIPFGDNEEKTNENEKQTSEKLQDGDNVQDQKSENDQSVLDSSPATTTALDDNVPQESSIKKKLSKLLSFGGNEDKTDENARKTREKGQDDSNAQVTNSDKGETSPLGQTAGKDQTLLDSKAATTAANVPQESSFKNKLSQFIPFGNNEEKTNENEEQTSEKLQHGDNVQDQKSENDQSVLDSSPATTAAHDDNVPKKSSIKNKLSKLLSFGGNEDKTDENARQTREKEQNDSNAQVKNSDKGETSPLGQTAGKDRTFLDSKAATEAANVPKESSFQNKLSQLIPFGNNEEKTNENEGQTSEKLQHGDNVQDQKSGKDQSVLDSKAATTTANVPQESSIKNKLSKLLSFGGNEDKTDENAKQTREKEQDDNNAQVTNSDKGETSPLGQTAGKDQSVLDSKAATTTANLPQESSIKNKLSKLISFGDNEEKTDENKEQTMEKQQDEDNDKVKSTDKGESSHLVQSTGKDQSVLDSSVANTNTHNENVHQESSIKNKLSKLTSFGGNKDKTDKTEEDTKEK